MPNTANDFIDKHNKGVSYTPEITNRFYLYRLRSGNSGTYEIGYVTNPQKDIDYNWDDVNARICEGFWGDKPMVTKVVKLLNGL